MNYKHFIPGDHKDNQHQNKPEYKEKIDSVTHILCSIGLCQGIKTLWLVQPRANRRTQPYL